MDKPQFYEDLAEELALLLAGERHWMANAANTAALLFMRLQRTNWVGFYFLDGDELILGPFQGKPACTRIAIDRGVCGAAAGQQQTLVVPDVHRFPGHIACDAASNSEVVVPIRHRDHLLGVLDIDSPDLHRFDSADGVGLERIVAIYCSATDFGKAFQPAAFC